MFHWLEVCAQTHDQERKWGGHDCLRRFKTHSLGLHQAASFSEGHGHMEEGGHLNETPVYLATRKNGDKDKIFFRHQYCLFKSTYSKYSYVLIFLYLVYSKYAVSLFSWKKERGRKRRKHIHILFCLVFSIQPIEFFGFVSINSR